MPVCYSQDCVSSMIQWNHLVTHIQYMFQYLVMLMEDENWLFSAKRLKATHKDIYCIAPFTNSIGTGGHHGVLTSVQDG